MSLFRNEDFPSFDKTNFVWGAKLTGCNYKAVTICGELFALGDCVRCLWKCGEGQVGKIIKLSQKEGTKICRIRRFFSSSEFPSFVKGLTYIPEPKELFLASGEGPGVEKDIFLEKIAGRCFILCTAEEHFNEMPSSEQIKTADYFFRSGYDPASEEIVGLDSVEEEIGAQKVYNKKDWLVDKMVRRSSSQIPASRVHCQSPASGSSFHQGEAKFRFPSVAEVSPVPLKDLTEIKLKWKGNKLVPEARKDDGIENLKKLYILKKLNREMSATPMEKRNARSEHVVFAILAPSKTKSIQSLDTSPFKTKLPSLSLSEAKAPRREGEGRSLKVPICAPALVGSEQVAIKNEEMTSGNERKIEHVLSEVTLTKLIKPVEKSILSDEREEPSKAQIRVDEGVVCAAVLVGSTEVGTKQKESYSDRPKKKGKFSTEGIPNMTFNKLVERSNVSSRMKSPCKFQKRVDKGIIIATRGLRKLPSGPTLFTRKVLPARNVSSALTLLPSVMKMGSRMSSASPCALEEVLQANVCSRILGKDEVVLYTPSTSQRQSGSQTLGISSRKRQLSTATDLDCARSSTLESSRTTSSKDLAYKSMDTVSVVEPSSSTGAEQSLLNELMIQKPRGQIFKPRVEDWDISLVSAIRKNRVLVLKNLVPGLHSEELAGVLTQAMRIRCEVRISPPVTSDYQITTALLKLPSAKKAQDAIHEMESKYISVANRLVSVALFNYHDFKAPQLSKYPGHLEFPKEGRDFISEDYKNAVATSHLAQGNTIEFAFGLPWRVLDEQHKEQWRMLQAVYPMLC